MMRGWSLLSSEGGRQTEAEFDAQSSKHGKDDEMNRKIARTRNDENRASAWGQQVITTQSLS
jgi:hypothetical protein